MSFSGDNGEGRRQHKRLMREIPFNYEIEDKHGSLGNTGQWRNGLVLDISSGGVRFLAMDLLAKNTVLVMEFDLRDLFKEDYHDYLPDLGDYEGPVKIKGKVMWSTATVMEDEYEVGVQFIENA